MKNKKEGSDRSQINTLIELDSSVTRNVMTGEFADDLEGAVSVWKSTAGLPGNKNSKPVRVHLVAVVIIESRSRTQLLCINTVQHLYIR